MSGWESDVELTLTSPDKITYDKSFPNRECFYRTGTPLNPATLLKVVVEFSSEGTGSVITAYPTRLISQKERQKWP